MSDYSEYETKLLANIEEHGWQLTYVFDPDGMEPDFGYSVGFTKSLASPEFIIFGLPRDLIHNMLWEIYRQVKRGLELKDGLRVQDLLEGFDCILRKADHKELYQEYLVSADWFWKDCGHVGHPEAYQIVWPGAQDGLFPWDDDCHESVIKAQTRLWVEG